MQSFPLNCEGLLSLVHHCDAQCMLTCVGVQFVSCHQLVVGHVTMRCYRRHDGMLHTLRWDVTDDTMGCYSLAPGSRKRARPEERPQRPVWQ
eukprot:1178051-Prorocentrum_minimum.AAC.3